MDKIFKGKRGADGSMQVTCDGKPLKLRSDIVHRVDKQSQLAVSILAAAATDEIAIQHYQSFQTHLLSRLPDEWELTEVQIAEFIMLYCVGSRLLHSF